MNSKGKDSQNQSKRAKSPARWQDVAICWMIGIPTVLGIICSAIFLAFLAWVVIEKIWAFLIVFSIAISIVLWICVYTSEARNNKDELKRMKIEGK